MHRLTWNIKWQVSLKYPKEEEEEEEEEDDDNKNKNIIIINVYQK